MMGLHITTHNLNILKIIWGHGDSTADKVLIQHMSDPV